MTASKGSSCAKAVTALRGLSRCLQRLVCCCGISISSTGSLTTRLEPRHASKGLPPLRRRPLPNLSPLALAGVGLGAEVFGGLEAKQMQRMQGSRNSSAEPAANALA